LTSKKSSSSSALVIEDVIPLFHQCLALAPMAEVALAQAEVAAQSRNLMLAGLYCAPESFRESSADVFSQRLADKVAEHYTNAILAVVDNKRLGGDFSAAPFILSQSTGESGKWRSLERASAVLGEGASEAASNSVETIGASVLVDFDNHLDDLKLDFMNAELNDMLEAF